jgi:hypothetical protein
VLHCERNILSRVYVWIRWLDLLTPSCTISLNHNQSSTEPFFLDRRGLAPFSFSRSTTDFWFTTGLLLESRGWPTENTSYIVEKSMFTAPLPSNRCHIVPRVCFCANVFSDPLPSNGHGADYIENNPCNTFSIVSCAHFGCCLEMGLHVTIYWWNNWY